MNKYNSSSLIEFNNIIQTLTSKKYDEIIKDKHEIQPKRLKEIYFTKKK